MAYLLDTNVFIQAKNRHYGMDFCPAFWDWLREQHQAGRVFSIEKVFDELQERDNGLSQWATEMGGTFFLPPREPIVAALNKVSEWVLNQDYRPSAITAFLQDADYFLIAHALAHNCVVVTHEAPSDGVKNVKIPNVCIGVQVKSIDPFTMLRRERARFVLDR